MGVVVLPYANDLCVSELSDEPSRADRFTVWISCTSACSRRYGLRVLLQSARSNLIDDQLSLSERRAITLEGCLARRPSVWSVLCPACGIHSGGSPPGSCCEALPCLWPAGDHAVAPVGGPGRQPWHPAGQATLGWTLCGPRSLGFRLGWRRSRRSSQNTGTVFTWRLWFGGVETRVARRRGHGRLDGGDQC